MPLGYHWGADEDVRLPALELPDNLVVRRARARGVEVHARRARLGQDGPYGGLNLLRAVAQVAPVGVATVGAAARHLERGSAVVTHHAVLALVEGQADVAARAARYPAARVTLNDGRVAPAVLEQNDLLALLQRLLHFLNQSRREGRVHEFLAAQLLDVLHLDDRQLDVAVALRQAHQAVFARQGVVVALDGRCGRAQQHLGAVEAGGHGGHVAGVVARGGVLLLVGGFVLLVHDNQAEPPEGQEERRAHAQNQAVGLVGELLLPDFHALGVGKLGVVHAHLLAKHARHALHDLRGQGYFGQQVEHLLAAAQAALDELGVDFGLSARGDAVKQADVLLPEHVQNFVKSLLLRFAQRRLERLGQGLAPGQAPYLKGIRLQNTLAAQCREGRLAAGAVLHQVSLGHLGHQVRLLHGQGCRQSRKLQVGCQQGLLLGRPLQLVERLVQAALGGPLRGKAYVQLSTGTEGAAHGLAQPDGTFVHQAAHQRQGILDVELLLQRLHRAAAWRQDEREGLALAVGQRVGGLKSLFSLHHALALQLQARGHGGFHHLARRAHVILRHPLPQFQLSGQQNGVRVLDLADLFEQNAFGGRIMVDAGDNAGVVFPLAQRHHYAHARLYLLEQGFGQDIGERITEGQGNNYINIRHSRYKITLFPTKNPPDVPISPGV
ncbi:uncharacterized protein BN736_01468 [Prevotella sp. CAG:617]|nr:uncharacterized protein BN736_01468 [Prevotella sp. CAG:617]